jgi:small subunit ribosomal protein S7
MPRRGQVPRREVALDPLTNNRMVTRLINKVMYDGKRDLAARTVYDAFEIIEEQTKQDPVEIFEQAMKNIMPLVEVRARRVGGANYQVPIEVRPERKFSLGLRWLVGFARKRNERTMKERLAGEILDASKNAGGAVKRREEMHRMAEANKAFAHYRW